MFNRRSTPPSLLHSPSLTDRESSSSRGTTPATPATPAATASPPPTPQIPWFQRPPCAAPTTTRLCLESSLINPDFDESTFPLFDVSPANRSMAIIAQPDDRLNTRQTSTSPRGNQPSSLTAAIKRTTSGDPAPVNDQVMEAPRPTLAVPESSDMSRFENGARPISVKGKPIDKNRRESLAQSLGMGMSWGGASVGSWIRDE